MPAKYREGLTSKKQKKPKAAVVTDKNIVVKNCEHIEEPPEVGVLPAVEPPPVVESPKPVYLDLTCADGMKYILVRFWFLFKEDTIAINQALVAIRKVEQGWRPPNWEQCWRSSTKRNWSEQFEEIAKAYGPRTGPISATQPPGKRNGRPKRSDTEWT
jgi:hypothetical protein